MLKEVVLENFFSYQKPESVKLNPGVNLLLGINGSGKTGFINALRLLVEGVVGDGLETLINKTWGGFEKIVNANGKERKDFFKLTYVFSAAEINKKIPKSPFKSDLKYEIIVHSKGVLDYSIEENLISVNNNSEGKTPYFYLANKNGHGFITINVNSYKTQTDGSSKKTHKVIQEKYSGDLKDKELITSQSLDRKRYLPIYMFRQIVSEMSIYNYFNMENLKIPPLYYGDSKLRSDGINLPYLLVQLRRLHPDVYEKIEKNLRKVNPNYKTLFFEPYGSQLYLSLQEKNLNHSIGVEFLSAGTLQFLLMLSIFYNPNRGKIVAVDEPERGLHPDMVKSIADMIKEAAKDSQLIIATHSPLLLNQFELNDVLIFEKDEDNCSQVNKKKEDDFSKEDDYLPGQMWLMGLIGGKRW